MSNIAKLDFEVITLKLRHPWTIARGTSETRTNVFVTLKKDGITGYGEAAPNPRYDETADTTVAALARMAPVLRQADLSNFYDLSLSMRKLCPQQAAAVAAVDIALLDWVCKRLRVPLYRYLGLGKDSAPVTTYSIGIDDRETTQKKVAEADAYPVLKIKLGMGNDEEIIETVRSVTNKPLRVDVNEGWHSREEALEKSRWLQSQNVELLEQPFPASQLEDTAWLRERVEIPVFADENVMSAQDIPTLAQAFDGINIKVMKSGGLQEALRMIYLAKALGMQVMLGCMVESSLAISAAAALSPLVDYADLDGNLLIQNDPFSGVTVDRGKLVLTETPGVGAEPAAETA